MFSSGSVFIGFRHASIYFKAAVGNAMSRVEKAVIAVFIVGVALIIAGQSVYRYASTMISGLEARLSPSLPLDEYWIVEGSLKWWRPALISIYGPVSLYLMVAGIALLAFLTAYAALSILRSERIRIA